MVEGILSGDVTFAQPQERLIPTADASKRVEAKGVIQPDDLHIFLSEEILLEVISYSASDVTRELGGVFVGTLYSHRGMAWLLVEGYLRARHYVNTAASFRFTHDTWSDITRERERRFNDKLMVGWQHTHPGYGIFLSSMDRFIQEHFFNLPWMVALVVDPKQENLGFFQWKRGEITPCGFFYVRDAVESSSVRRMIR